MIWTILFILGACALLVIAGCLLKGGASSDDLVVPILLTIIALAAITACSWRGLYLKGVKKGYPTTLGHIPSDQIYRLFGQVQGSKRFVVILENAQGEIRCVAVSEAIDPNTEYIKKASFEEEITFKRQKDHLVPVKEGINKSN